MNKRILKIAGWVVALLLILGVGATIGGGIVYAKTRNSDSITFSFPSDKEMPFESEPGIVIAAVVPDGPADEAGVVRGDILLQVDGEAVDDVIELTRVLEERKIGDEVELTIVHGDDEFTLTATLGERDNVAYLGVVPCAGVPVPDLRLTIHTTRLGAMITDVVDDSPADQADLQAGDVIVAVDEQELDSENSLADVIATHEPGDAVTLGIERSGEESRVTVTLDEHPEEEGIAYLGVKYQSFHPVRVLEDERLPFGRRHSRPFPHKEFFHIVPDEWESGIMKGAIIYRVDEDSPAEAADLREGDLVTAIEGESVTGPQDLADAIAERKPGDKVTLTISQSGEDEREVEVTLTEHPDEDGKAYLGVHIGGFIHIHHLGDGERHDELDLDLQVPFDELPFEFDSLPHDFEFHFPPEHFYDGGIDCCGESV
ncbi:MAG: PDZ domain-containing protein [Chloroflexota bacterium]|nr:PDZ domain-containing protein [Chloroflexota bacterium]